MHMSISGGPRKATCQENSSTYTKETLLLYPYLGNEGESDLYNIIYRASEMNIESFGEILWNYSRFNTGKGILDYVRNKYSFAKHLIFSLLKGRPVVVIGKPNSDSDNPTVRATVQALSIFVCGSYECVEWLSALDKPLGMAIFANIKLLGLSKDIIIPKPVEKYVSVLDIENEKLHAPTYDKGRFIEHILDTKKQWPDETTCMAYVHYILYDIAMKACLYYHMCSVPIHGRSSSIQKDPSEQDEQNEQDEAHSPLADRSADDNAIDEEPSLSSFSTIEINKYSHSAGTIETGDSDPLKTGTFREERKKTFFKDLKIAPCDGEILEYFVEVVKEQQSNEVNGVDQSHSAVIKLDYSDCKEFPNQR